MNILIDLLPSSVEIEGTEYEIRSDFRTSVLFSILMEDKEVPDSIKYEQALDLYYPVIPKNKDEAIEKIIWFYSLGKEEQEVNSTTGKNKKVFDYEEDAIYIYSAFMSDYRIDLQDIEYLHWWKFKSLLEGLKDTNRLNEIIKYRSVDVNKIKDKEEKKFYKKMQRIYKLDNKASKEDIEELKRIKEKYGFKSC